MSKSIVVSESNGRASIDSFRVLPPKSRGSEMSFETFPEFLTRRAEESRCAATRCHDPKMAFVQGELAKRYRDALDDLHLRDRRAETL